MPNEKYPKSRLTNRGFWIKAGVYLAVSAWMFMLGILVGRGTAPVQFDIHRLEQMLLSKRQAADQKEMEALSNDIQSGPKNTELGFYEALKSAKTDDQLSDLPTKSDLKAKTRPKSEKDKVSAEAKSAVGLYTVQVASLRSKESSQRIADELKKKGYNAFVAASSSSGAGPWYRVRIGNYKRKSDAVNMAERMKNESFQPIVVRRK